MAEATVTVRGLAKTFILHLQGGIRLPVLQGVDLDVQAGECVALNGPSGVGKSTLLRCLYGNYRADAGHITLRDEGIVVDMATAEPRHILAVRRRSLGYVSQFLRVVPRVPAIDVVAEPLRALGVSEEAARERARALLQRLHIPERLWALPPATFSGGEQQRINIARGFAHSFPIMLLDEPTAALDADNQGAVIDLIRDARERGTAMVGIFHDPAVRQALATRLFDMKPP
ncbi:MAG: phosphonate C-P lyase system protein PhnL [Alphaproteobacteria bacterium]|nr:phosphonate C-P lyase system protein PhnL [Alphaproteobacteria bacterium]